MAEKMLKRIMIAFFLLMLGWGIGYFHHYLAVAGASDYIAEVETNEKVIAAMEYHGIKHCAEVNGRHTFRRDSQTCQLYTQAFEKHWNKGGD